MNKSGIVEKVHELTGIKKGECETVIDAFILAIKEALIMGERISIRDFLIFEIVDRKPQKRRNPTTGLIELYPQTKALKCRLSEGLKNLVKE